MKKTFLSLLTIVMCNAALAETPLNKTTVQGEYLIQAKDEFIVARLSLAKKSVSMTYADAVGIAICEGSYSFDVQRLVVKTVFNDCFIAKTHDTSKVVISHQINLDGQTIESLKATADVLISLRVGDVFVQSMPFTIHKLK